MKTSTFQFLSLCFIFFSLSLLPHSHVSAYKLCSPTCRTCSGPNDDQCANCPSALTFSSASCSCASGYYFSAIKGSCSACSSSCQTCSGSSSSSCLSCPGSQLLYAGSCHAACTSSQYFDTALLSCQPCHSLCRTCTGSSYNQCSSCNSATLTDSSCQCTSGQYTTAGGNCAVCNPSCLECSGGSSTECTSCISGMILQNGQCLCPTGSYLTTSPVGCSTCDGSCKGCTAGSPSDCTSCNSNLMVVSGVCQCPSGKFYDTSTSTCLSCNTRCSACTGPSSTQCTACKNNLVLSASPGTCSCGSGTYLDSSTYTCKPCDSTCAECSGSAATSCTSCISGFTVTSGRCQCSSGCSCPSGKYYDSVSLTCKACHPQCATCTGGLSTQCSTCRSGFTPSSGSCLCAVAASCSCPSGYFLNTASSNTCTACDSSCAECSGTGSSSCTSPCPNNLAFSSGTCSCAIGYYINAGFNYCYACDSTCRTCSGPAATQCTSCRSGMTYTGSSTGTCSCSSTQYYDKGSNTCKSCDSNCLTCSGPDKNQCLSCAAGTTLDNGYCKDTCTTSEYRDTDFSCQDCDDTCRTCNGGTSSSCASCFSPQVLTSNTCPTVNTNGCYYSCGTCTSSSANHCLTCVSTWVLTYVGVNYGYCQATCPVDYYRTTVGGQAVCLPRTFLNNKLAYGSSQNNIQLTFGTDISGFLAELKNSIEVAIQFKSNQPSVTYKYTLSITTDNLGLNLNLTFNGHLLAGNVLYITYDLPVSGEPNTVATIGVTKGVQMLRLLEYYGGSAGGSSDSNAASTVSSIGISANNVFSWTSSILLRSVHSLRSRAVEDMIGYLIFINTDYTQNFIDFGDNSLNSFEMLMPNLFQYIINDMDAAEAASSRLLLSENQEEQRSSRLARILSLKNSQGAIDDNLTSRQFLVNHGAATSLLVISLLLIGFVDALWFTMMKVGRFPRAQKFLKAASISFRWNFTIGHFMGEYQGFIFFSLLEISSNLKHSKKSDTLNFIFAIMIFIFSSVGVLGQFLATRVLQKKLKERDAKKAKAAKEAREAAKEIAKEPAKEGGKEASAPIISAEEESTFLERGELLHNSFKYDRLMDLMYPQFLSMRCFGFAFVLIFCGNASLFQVLYLVLTTIAMIGYLVYYKPLDTHFQQVLTVFYEALFLSIITGVLVLVIYNRGESPDLETRKVICVVILSLSTCMFGLNLVSFVFELVELKNKFFPKKNKVTPLQASQTAQASMLTLKPENITAHSRTSTLIVPNPVGDTEEYQQLNIRKLRDMMTKDHKVTLKLLPDDKKMNKSHESLKNDSPNYFAPDGERRFKFTENPTAENTPDLLEKSKGKNYLMLKSTDDLLPMSSFAGSSRLYSPHGNSHMMSDTEDPLTKKSENRRLRDSVGKPSKAWTQKIFPRENNMQSINLDDHDPQESPPRRTRNLTIVEPPGERGKGKTVMSNIFLGKVVSDGDAVKSANMKSLVLDEKDNFGKKKPRTLGDKRSEQRKNSGGSHLLDLLTNTLKIKAFGDKSNTGTIVVVPEEPESALSNVGNGANVGNGIRKKTK